MQEEQGQKQRAIQGEQGQGNKKWENMAGEKNCSNFIAVLFIAVIFGHGLGKVLVYNLFSTFPHTHCQESVACPTWDKCLGEPKASHNNSLSTFRYT